MSSLTAPETDPATADPEPQVPSTENLISTLTQEQSEPPGRPELPPTRSSVVSQFLPILAWFAAFASLILAVYVWQPPQATGAVTILPTPAAQSPPTTAPSLQNNDPDVQLPSFQNSGSLDSITRLPNPYTIIPNRPRAEVIQYAVDFGDSVFGIANNYNITPETVLWANYSVLNDNPDYLELGMKLNIPPVDGVYYEWQEGDTLDSVAQEFEADIDDIVNFTANGIDVIDLVVSAGEMVMIPGGQREFRQWLIPVFDRGGSGVLTGALGPGACTGSYTGPVGSGAFIWPMSNHFISGNDFWGGHLAIDIAGVGGNSVWSSDAGVVIFTGWANGGYGNTVIVDHGNGYQTLYAHLSGVALPCGAGVGAGSTIGYAGSTGNSTGAHLHFEVRFNGGFINPWFVLPAP